MPIQRLHINNSYEEHVTDYAMILQGYCYRIANGSGVLYTKTWKESEKICKQYRLSPKKAIGKMSPPELKTIPFPIKSMEEPEYSKVSISPTARTANGSY